jgi:hypothetical protein
MEKKQLILLSIICMASALSFKKHAAATDFCWKDSYGRGVGTIPSVCPEGQEQAGVFCY